MLLCSFGIEPYLLQVALPFLPSFASCLFVGIDFVVVAAENSSSYCSPTVSLDGSSNLNCMCWSRGSNFDNY